MKKKLKTRLYTYGFAFFSISLGIILVLLNISDNISLYVTPTEVIEKNMKHSIKLGGYVKEGSIIKKEDNFIYFVATDYKTDLNVAYQGNVPIIFRDGQGVVLYGEIVRGEFKARKLLTKHDEKYMPEEANNKE